MQPTRQHHFMPPEAIFAVALELSNASWKIAMNDGKHANATIHTVSAEGASQRLDQLTAEIEKIRTKWNVDDQVRTTVLYEAGQDGFWIYRALMKLDGYDVHICDPSSIPVARAARRAKTDRLDAILLLETLLAWLRGERHRMRVIHVPSAADEEQRHLLRERGILQKESMQHRDRILKLLRTVGCWHGVEGDIGARLASGQLRCYDGSPLPPALLTRLQRECDRIAVLEEQFAAIETGLIGELKPASQERVAHLRKLKGVGPVGAARLVAELFDASATVGGVTGVVSSTGRAYVVFGTASTTPISLSAIAAGTGGFVINGGATAADAANTPIGFQVGISVSGAGDINGDGMADLLVSAPYHLAQNNTAFAGGKYYVVYGKAAAGSALAPVNINNLGSGTTAVGYGINGNGAGTNTGSAVAGVGDTTGDGLADLLIGASGWDAGSAVDAGRATLLVGSFPSGQLGNAAGTVINHFVGTGAADRIGSSVAAGGDFNGDGLADVVLGGGAVDVNGADAGQTYVLFGRTGTPVSTALDATNVAKYGITISGAGAGDMAGVSAVGVGDVNGDGLADLLIGARGADVNGALDAGRSYVVFGRAGSANIQLSDVAGGAGGFVINGESAGDASGVKVAGAGDLNGDGLADLLISATGADTAGGVDAGRTYVVYGSAATTPVELSAIAAGRGGFVIDGAGTGDQSGAAVAAAGDVNGDGLGDLIVSAALADPNGMADAGTSYVIFGASGGAFQSSRVDQSAGGGQAALTGSAAGETLIGDADANTLTGNGGADVIYAGSGNDTVVLNAGNAAALHAVYGVGDNTAQLARIDGGGGIDTLKLDGGGITFDLTAIRDAGLAGGINMSRLASIEKIDLTGSGNNSLKVGMADVVDLAGMNLFNNAKGWVDGTYDLGGGTGVEGRHQLVIDGDAGDSVVMSGIGWSPTSVGTVTNSGHTYDVYTNGTYTELLIDTSIGRSFA